MGKATFGLAAIRIYLGLARTPVDPLARSPPTLFSGRERSGVLLVVAGLTPMAGVALNRAGSRTRRFSRFQTTKA